MPNQQQLDCLKYHDLKLFEFEGDDFALEDNISVRRTIFLLVFGISIPTYDLPSISITLTLLTDNDLAIS